MRKVLRYKGGMYLSIKEAANTMRMSRQAVYDLIKAGKIRSDIVGEHHLVVADRLVRTIAHARATNKREPYPDGGYAMRTCPCCHVTVKMFKNSGVCLDCAAIINHVGGKARGVMKMAIKRGEIQKARGRKCVDCGKPATELDHRYYSRPLDVEPVCRGCNKKRGFAYDALDLARAKISPDKLQKPKDKPLGRPKKGKAAQCAKSPT